MAWLLVKYCLVNFGYKIVEFGLVLSWQRKNFPQKYDNFFFVSGKAFCKILLVICWLILPTAEIQFQINREGWRIRMAREAEGLESHLDSPAFEMDLKLFRGRRENRQTNNDFVHQAATARLADKVTTLLYAAHCALRSPNSRRIVYCDPQIRGELQIAIPKFAIL